MSFNGQRIIPAVKNMKQFETFLDSSYEYGIFLDTHIAQLRQVSQMSKEKKKKILIHSDIVQGLKNDEYATEYLCQEIKPFGIISTRSNVILKVKQKGLIAIQRVFILDSQALEKSYMILKNSKADYVEILPGVIPSVIKEMSQKIEIPILAGGLVQTIDEMACAINAGALAVTTSSRELWKRAEKIK
ncbi:glycerol-3-phosphate responsive antiterminator [Bacillus sp. Bva_UNVM-123]|uniref:glycerol-3-phosphate responsive antiterminator n=1 Tax=Bacillus sp. Bva_UNVM-123 TaxID=2829798 RepID=UPI00391F55D0